MQHRVAGQTEAAPRAHRPPASFTFPERTIHLRCVHPVLGKAYSMLQRPHRCGDIEHRSIVMARLATKKALVTGGTSGISLETARRFVEEGARVIVTGTNPDNIAEAQRVLGPDTLVIKADASDVAGQKDVARIVAERFGTLDIAFLNAGVATL
jgi:NADPH:quinone reductase-like Zn-dependent oxidoreductase